MPTMPQKMKQEQHVQYPGWEGRLTGGPGGPGKPGRPEVQEQAGAKVGQVSSSL